jgi:hypothetical protein
VETRPGPYSQPGAHAEFRFSTRPVVRRLLLRLFSLGFGATACCPRWDDRHLIEATPLCYWMLGLDGMKGGLNRCSGVPVPAIGGSRPIERAGSEGGIDKGSSVNPHGMLRASGSDDEIAVAVFIREDLGIWILDSITALISTPTSIECGSTLRQLAMHPAP